MAPTELPPLPQALLSAVAEALGRDGMLSARANPGLVFERYPRCWQAAGGQWQLGTGRKDFLTRFATAYERLAPACEPFLKARVAALNRALGGGREYRAGWRFMTGVGSDHPLENGFSFHRLLGVPYFPGSTVKGLARAAARVAGIGEADDGRFFGSVAPKAGDQGGSAASGGVVFLDALPVTWPRLGVDLLNNHRPTWTAFLNGGGRREDLERVAAASAAGLEDPVPVYFLAVEPGVAFRFWIGERPGAKLGGGDLGRVWSWLELGLRYLGIGAKTAVGYGRFVPGRSGEAEEREPPRSSTGRAVPVSKPGAPVLKKGDRVRLELTQQSKKGKWQGRLADYPESFGTLLGDPPADAAVGRTFEVIVGVAGDLTNMNLRWP